MTTYGLEFLKFYTCTLKISTVSWHTHYVLIKRCNYKAYIWRNAHQLALLLPPPKGLGWEVNDVGALEIKWTEGELMPHELADIIVHTLAEDDEDDEEIP